MRAARRFLALLAAVVVMLPAVDLESAWAWPSGRPMRMTESAKLMWSLPIAQRVFPRAWNRPECPEPIVHLTANDEIAAAFDGGMTWAMAEWGGCQVWMGRGMGIEMFCHILVHEFGHLAGRDDENNGSIMDTAYPMPFWRCEWPRILTDQAVSLWREDYPRPRWDSGCSVRDAPRRVGRRHGACWARTRNGRRAVTGSLFADRHGTITVTPHL